MFPENRNTLMLLATLPLFFAGCAASRSQLSSHDEPTVPDRPATSLASESRPSGGMQPPIRTVAFQEDGAAPPILATDAQPDQLAAPLELDSAPLAHSGVHPGMTLEAVEQLALANNPAIKQASAASARAGGIRTQVGLKPNPVLGYSGMQLADANTDQHVLFVEQTFVRGDKLAWNRQVISHDINALNWHIEVQKQRVLTDVRLAFYEALAAQKRLHLAREFRQIAQQGVAISKERVTAKVGARPDVLQSEIQVSEVDLAMQRAAFEFSGAWNELTALAGVPRLAETHLVGELPPPSQPRESEVTFERIVGASPLFAAALARVDRARANLQRQQIQPTPNVTAHLGAGHDVGTGQGLVNVQLSAPLPVHNKNQGNIQAAHAEYCAAVQNVERIRAGVRRDLARVMREYQIADATARRYSELILPKADETLKLMQEAQEAGEFDFLRVLTARRTYFDASLRYVTALGDLARANAKIDGLLLSDGLSNVVSYDGDASLRDQALSGQ